MNEEQRADQQAREGKSVADLLHDWSSGAKSRGRNVGTAVVVDHNANGNVETSHHGLAEEQGSVVMAGVPHLRRNGEECRRAGICKDDCRDARDGRGK